MNEIADATVFINYFIYGADAFAINVVGQTAATDVNADGIVLTVADLTYLIRIIVGDALPIPKLAPNYGRAAVYMLADNSTITVATELEENIGSAYFVFEYSGYKTGQPYLADGASEMTFVFHDEKGVLKVLVYSVEKGNKIESGINNIFVLPLSDNGDISLHEVQLSGYRGNIVKTTIHDRQLLPQHYYLYQNYPNPFNPATEIKFAVPQTSDISLEIYHILGRRVATLINSRLEAGYHSARCNGIESEGHEVSTGIYFYRIQAGDFVQTIKMLLLK